MRLKGVHLWSLLGFMAGMLIIYWTGWPNDLYIGISLAVGLVVNTYYFACNHLPVEDSRSGIWIIVLTAFMMLMSYFGSSSFSNVIHYPYDVLAVIVVAVAFFYWGVGSGKETKEVREHVANPEAVDAED